MKNLLVIFFLLSTQFGWSQEYTFRINDMDLDLVNDTVMSTDGYMVYKNKTPLTVIRLNSPSKVSQGLDFSHREINIIDSLNAY